MSYSLIVIDVQDSFRATDNARLQRACQREIRKAIRDKAAILFVEFIGHGRTLPILTDLVKEAHYHRAYTVYKNEDDGSKQIKACLLKNHLPRLALRVVGVNTNYCVLRSVRGLSHKFVNSTIQVVGDACNSNSGRQHRDGLQELKHFAKLLRVPGST